MRAILLLAMTILVNEIDISWTKAQTRTSFDFHGYSAFLIDPHNPAPGRPWIWVMPAWLVDTKDPAIGNTGIMDFYIKTALDKGIAIAGVEIGVTFGSPVAAKFNHTFYQYMRENGFNRKPRLLLQSNGALSGYRWAYQHPRLVDRIVGIFPVLNLNSWPERKFLEGPDCLINPAWMFLPVNFDTACLSRNSPIALMQAPLSYNVATLLISGTSDVVVPIRENSGLAKLQYGSKIQLIRVPGLGHQIAPEFHQNEEVAKFLTGGL